MKFIQWLKSLFTKKESEEMSDQSVTDTTATDTTTAATDATATVDTTTAATTAADTTTAETATADTGIVAAVEHDLSQFYDVVKELTERFGAEYKELAIDFAKAVSVKK